MSQGTIKIKSIKTGLVHDVTPEGWELMKKQGRAAKYTVISGESTSGSVPAAVQNSDYSGLLKTAKDSFEAKDYEAAKDAYAKAGAIKSSNHITKQIEKIDALIAASKNTSASNTDKA